MHSLWALVLLLQIFYSNALLFNTSLQEDCLNGCIFSNASLWEGNQDPGPNDEVIITFNSSSLSPSIPLSSLFFIINNDTQVNSISLNSANLKIDDSKVSLMSISVDQYSTLIATGGAIINCAGDATFSGNVTLGDKTLLSGPNSATLVVSDDSFFTLNDDSYLSWYIGDCYFSGTVTASASAIILCSNSFIFGSVNVSSVFQTGSLKVNSSSELIELGGCICDYISVADNNSVSIYNFIKSQIYLRGGAELNIYNAVGSLINNAHSGSSILSGSGYLSIHDSNITFTNVAEFLPITTLIIFFGQSTLYANNVEVQQLEVGVTSKFDPTVIDFYGNNVLLSGRVYFRNVVVYGSGVNITDTLVISSSGSLSVVDSTLVNQGAINSDSNITLAVVNSSIIVAGNFTNVQIELDSNSTFSVTGPSFILTGGILSNGIVKVKNAETLTISDGDFVQTNEAEMMVEINYHKASSPALTASIISLNGKLQYYVDSKPIKSYSFLIASASHSLVSNMTDNYAESAENSELSRDLAVQVKENDIYLNYKLNPKDLPNWIYFVSAAGVLLLTLFIVAVIVKHKRNNDYQSL